MQYSPLLNVLLMYAYIESIGWQIIYIYYINFKLYTNLYSTNLIITELGIYITLDSKFSHNSDTENSSRW